MKTLMMITITLLFLGCGSSNSDTESSVTPPQPNATISTAPPTSPTLE